jgi:phage FluMu protein Com
MKQPLGRINPVQSVACPTCRKVLSENALQLALQGKSVRCAGCRAEIKLSEATREQIRRSRRA